MVHFIHLMPLCILDNMAKQPMSISDEDYKKVNEAIDAVKEDGKSIRLSLIHISEPTRPY